MTAMVEIDDIEDLARIVTEALYKAERVWKFLHQQDAPDNLEVTLRAHVLGGADTATICGAIVLAAQKPGLDYDSQLTYAGGIIRASCPSAISSRAQ